MGSQGHIEQNKTDVSVTLEATSDRPRGRTHRLFSPLQLHQALIHQFSQLFQLFFSLLALLALHIQRLMR